MQLIFENVTNLVYLGKRIWEKTDNNGQKEVVYYISVDSQDGFCSFQCTLELFNSINDLPKYTPINIATLYDSFDRSFKVVKLVPVNK